MNDQTNTITQSEESKNQVSARHRNEWQTFRKIFLEPCQCESADLDLAKLAKAVADILKVYQEGERKAWGFADDESSQEMQISWEQ